MPQIDVLPIEGLPEPVSVRVLTGATALKRLVDLGVDAQVLEDALMAGHNGSQLATAHHAPTAAGTYRWHETLASLRQSLVLQEWEATDEKNAPRIVSPNRKVSLMVATGNAQTGTKKSPSNATPKGVMTERDVWNNRHSDHQALEGLADLLSEPLPVTWVLLYFYSKEKNHIRVELSQPAPDGFKDGYIRAWKERIILPTLEFGSTELLLDAQPDSTPDIDFLIGDAEAS